MNIETYQELTENRLVLLLENEPMSNTYNQLVLTDKQFKQVSDLVSSFYTKVGDRDGIETIIMKLNDEDIKLPKDLTSFE